MRKRTHSGKKIKIKRGDYITRDIMRWVKKNNNKTPNKSANKKSADEGELADKISTIGPPVMSLVKLTGEYTPKKTKASKSATKIPR